MEEQGGARWGGGGEREECALEGTADRLAALAFVPHEQHHPCGGATLMLSTVNPHEKAPLKRRRFSVSLGVSRRTGPELFHHLPHLRHQPANPSLPANSTCHMAQTLPMCAKREKRHPISTLFAQRHRENQSLPRGLALRCVLVCAQNTFTKGSSIFSRSTDNGPAFP